jgi:predicted transcriptional regulator
MVARVIELSEELDRNVTELARRTGRAETDVLRDAIVAYVRAPDAMRPRSDGTIDDPDLAARDIDGWLAANWRPE